MSHAFEISASFLNCDNLDSLRNHQNTKGEVHVYPERLPTGKAFFTVPVDEETTVSNLLNTALHEFELKGANPDDYTLCYMLLDRGSEYDV